MSETPYETRVIAPVCPLGDEAEADPDCCGRCQAFHREAARVALGHSFRGAWFESLLVRGDGTCDLVVRHSQTSAD